MTPAQPTETAQPMRAGCKRVWCREGVPPERMIEALAQPGETLKLSKKSAVRRVGRCVIKESRERGLTALVKHTFRGARYRRAWPAARFLEEHGVGVPAAWAFIEHGLCGLVWRRTLISEYLDGFRNVEQFLASLIQQGAGHDTLALFFEAMADAVNLFTASGAFHEDLSGKNLFTRDGQHFRFIDLDAVVLGVNYSLERRLINHIQLYDSFCDQVSDHLLVPFITRMLPQEQDPRVWMPKVRKGQKARRLRTEKKWARQGKLLG